MTFKTHYNYFKYQVMFFDLTYASITFQDYINKILVEKYDIFVIMYFDDIPIYIVSKNEEHI